MAKVAGRKVRIYQDIGGVKTPVAGAVSDTLSVNNEALDGTDKNSNGWRELLSDASLRTVDMSVEGKIEGGTLLAAALGNTTALVSDYTIIITGIGTIAGPFHFSSFELGSPHDDVATFTASIMSAGEITFFDIGASTLPANTVLPTITGTAKVGTVLTSTTGTWTGTPVPAYARQWLADGAVILGATAATFTPGASQLGKVISVRVNATNAMGSVAVVSVATAAVIP